jgi:hypothetical protein
MSPKEPVVVRSKPEPSSNYHDYREVLRADFWYSCAYCTIAESEAKGITFEIDHYLPTSIRHDLAATYDNLYWSCDVCNRNKSDYPSRPEGPSKPEYYIIRADKEHPSSHLRLEENDLQPLTPTGEFNITWLHLNREPLQRLRELRRRLGESTEVCGYGISELRSLSIDRLPPEHRGRFMKLREEVANEYETLQEALSEFIKERTRSALLDPDKRNKVWLKQRRAFLREQQVIAPDTVRKKKDST